MQYCFFIFLFFTIVAIIFRFAVGNPITSSRMQTKYKVKSIPNIVNCVLFFSNSRKPIAVHIIFFQIQNYFTFIIYILLIAKCQLSFETYLKIESIAGFIIVILPLLIEKIVDIFNGENWATLDNKVQLSFDECKIIFLCDDKYIAFSFGTYINNQVVFLNDENLVIGRGTINYTKKELLINELNFNISYLKNNGFKITFRKL